MAQLRGEVSLVPSDSVSKIGRSRGRRVAIGMPFWFRLRTGMRYRFGSASSGSPARPHGNIWSR